MNLNSPLSRRSLFRVAGAALALGAGAAVLPQADAQGRSLGTVLDYSGGVPSAQAIKSAGHLGAVRYVSEPRAAWMKGKPVKIEETKAMAAAGLATASVYQYGKDRTADWREGAAGAAKHAPKAIALHAAAGGPTGKPIYVAIDDNPTRNEYETLIKPYLKGFSAALAAAGLKTGVYANYPTMDWLIADGMGEYFWQHGWGSNGKIHPRANVYQRPGVTARVGGVEVDINDVYTRDWGQWTPGTTSLPALQPSGTNTEPSGGNGNGGTGNGGGAGNGGNGGNGGGQNGTRGNGGQGGGLPLGSSGNFTLPSLDKVTINLPGGISVNGGQLRSIAEQAARLSS